MKALRLQGLAGVLACSLVALPAWAAEAYGGLAARASTALPAALQSVFYRALAKDVGAAYAIDQAGCAVLPQSVLKACFGVDGAHFTGGGSPLALHFVAYGRTGSLSSLNRVKPAIAGNRVRYDHGNLTEWWRVLPVGFEQGFTIVKRPAGHGELMLALASSRQDAAALTIRRSGEGQGPVKRSIPAKGRDSKFDGVPTFAGMRKREGDGALSWGRLRYGQLVVTDAHGKIVPATLKTTGNRILIAVNDAHAAYPLTVDPLVWLEQKVTATDGAAGDFFGYSVAISGTTVLVGATYATVNGGTFQGAVYVFDESGGTWTQTARLTASDGAAGDHFGYSVVLVGTTALVGAASADVNGNTDQGAVYVFTETNGTWTQTRKLTAGDGAANDTFGYSVALNGTTALVGAPFAMANGNFEQGTAYVFDESNGSWTQTAELTAGAANDTFGSSVALNGTAALVGAPAATVNGNQFQGAAYVFDRSGGSWTQTQKLTAGDGAAFDDFGSSVALSDTTALIGAFTAGDFAHGAAYVFGQSGGSWTQTAKLTAADGAVDDFFGLSVALSGTTALVGARDATVNGNQFQGAAYVFGESGGSWSQTRKLTASDGAAGDHFGYSVALSGTTALVGAGYATVNGNPLQGAAYFYGRSDLGLDVSTPETVEEGQQYVSQTIATNNASAGSPAVTATVTVPAAASFVSASASQGTCSEDSGVVTCDFGQINGNAGTATANVTLKATGNVGDTIDNTASVAQSAPPLTARAPTTIIEGGACPDGYAEYNDSLNPGQRGPVPPYRAPAGEENAILTAPAGFQLYAIFQNTQGRKVFRIPGNEIHRQAPAGYFTWVVKTGATGGAYTLCLQHP